MKISANTTIVINDELEVKFSELIDVYFKHRFRDILPGENEKLYKFRKNRFEKCFKILDNRGKYWYNDLTIEQEEELKLWRQKWLDVTETHIEPETPTWINNKLEGDEIL